jgi:septation ring formation regulator EzrA
MAKLASDVLQKDIDKLKVKIEENLDYLDKAIESNKKIGSSIEDLRYDLEFVATSHKSLAGEVKDLKEKIPARILQLELDTVKRIDKKIEEKIPEVNPDRIALAVKELIKVDLANVAADASNASLKYNNIGAQVQLIEKKIENLYLLIKKLEISKA